MTPTYDFSTGATIEFRLRLNASEGAGSCTFSFYDSADRGAILSIDNGLVNLPNSGWTPFDTLDGQFHTYTFTLHTQGANLLANLYLDGDPSPFLADVVIWAGYSGTSRANTLQFGDGTGANDADWDLDYLRWTAAGAFPPGSGPSAEAQDYNGDGIINLADFSWLSLQWLISGAPEEYDINGDGIVDRDDLALFAEQWLDRSATFYISDLSICTPASALAPDLAQDKWQLIDYETDLVNGAMISAPSFNNPPDVTVPVNAAGWFAIYVGYWYFGLGADGDHLVKIRLSDEPAFRQIYESVSVDTQNATYLREAFFDYADLTGRDIVLGKANGLLGKQMNLAYLKLVPLTSEEVAAILSDRENPGARKLVAAIDGFSFFGDSSYQTPQELLELVSLYRNSDVSRVLWQVNRGCETNYPSAVEGTSWVGRPHNHLALIDGDNYNIDIMAGEKQRYHTLRALQNAAQGNPHDIIADQVHDLGRNFHLLFSLGLNGGIPGFPGWDPNNMLSLHPEHRQLTRDGKVVNRAGYAFPAVRQFLIDLITAAASPIKPPANSSAKSSVRFLPSIANKQTSRPSPPHFRRMFTMIEKVFILHHTHVDFGYTAMPDEVMDQLVSMVDDVTQLVEGSSARPEPEQFRWIHEVSWPVLEYLRRTGKNQARILEHMRQGRTELTALYVNPTDLFDRAEFERTTDYACALARREALPLTTAMFSDCPGIAWSVADILAQRGIKYLSAGPDLIMSQPLELERPFYWVGPEGGRVLTWLSDWRINFYTEGLHYLRLHEDPAQATERLLDYITRLQNEGYRWRGLAVHFSVDNGPPRPELMNFVRHFNAAQSPVNVSMATNQQFFEFMETHHGPEFPTYQAAWPDWWANGHASAAYETSCSRRTKPILARTQALAAKHNARPDHPLRDEIHENLLMFDEHTFGHAATSTQPWSLPVRLTWTHKRAFAYNALHKAHRLEMQMLKDVQDSSSVVMVNPFDRDWSGLVRVKNRLKGPHSPTLTDRDTQQRIPGQRLPHEQSAYEFQDHYFLTMSPGQVRRFEFGEAQPPPPGEYPELENNHFLIEYDRQTGDVIQIHDRSTGSVLYDTAAPWHFAEVIHDRAVKGDRLAMYDGSLGARNPESMRPRPQFVYTPARAAAKPKLLTGPLFNTLLTKGSLPGLKFTREIRLYHHLHRLDIILHLDKKPVTTYESLYLAFPLAAHSPTIWVENADAVYRAGLDQLPGSAADWHSIGDYLTVEQDNQTIILCPHDVPLVQIGDIHTGKWAKRLHVTNGHLYSWLMNNMWYTNFPVYQEGYMQLTWSLTTHPGPFDKNRARTFADDVRIAVSCSASGPG